VFVYNTGTIVLAVYRVFIILYSSEMEERNVFYEKLDEYYTLKSKKKPFTKCAQLQMIAEIEMAKIKT